CAIEENIFINFITILINMGTFEFNPETHFDYDYFNTRTKDTNMFDYEKKRREYDTVVPGLIKAFSPESVLDVMCGRGELVVPDN
ncbi:MAG: hypothetical protein Q7U51_07200, partial [Methanoregula sp.]|nr:hypothetical protein [Methanoregula sp.]